MAKKTAKPANPDTVPTISDPERVESASLADDEHDPERAAELAAGLVDEDTPVGAGSEGGGGQHDLVVEPEADADANRIDLENRLAEARTARDHARENHKDLLATREDVVKQINADVGQAWRDLIEANHKVNQLAELLGIDP